MWMVSTSTPANRNTSRMNLRQEQDPTLMGGKDHSVRPLPPGRAMSSASKIQPGSSHNLAKKQLSPRQWFSGHRRTSAVIS
jgi:hypothetical protein